MESRAKITTPLPPLEEVLRETFETTKLSLWKKGERKELIMDHNLIRKDNLSPMVNELVEYICSHPEIMSSMGPVAVIPELPGEVDEEVKLLRFKELDSLKSDQESSEKSYKALLDYTHTVAELKMAGETLAEILTIQLQRRFKGKVVHIQKEDSALIDQSFLAADFIVWVAMRNYGSKELPNSKRKAEIYVRNLHPQDANSGQ